MNVLESLNRAKIAAASFGPPSPRDQIFETVSAMAEDGSWPVEHTGGFASSHNASMQLPVLRRLGAIA